MNALMLMPKDLSNHLYESKNLNGNAIVLCRFFHFGERKTVITNDYIEVKEFAHKYVNVGSKTYQ